MMSAVAGEDDSRPARVSERWPQNAVPPRSAVDRVKPGCGGRHAVSGGNIRLLPDHPTCARAIPRCDLSAGGTENDPARSVRTETLSFIRAGERPRRWPIRCDAVEGRGGRGCGDAECIGRCAVAARRAPVALRRPAPLGTESDEHRVLEVAPSANFARPVATGKSSPRVFDRCRRHRSIWYRAGVEHWVSVPFTP